MADRFAGSRLAFDVACWGLACNQGTYLTVRKFSSVSATDPVVSISDGHLFFPCATETGPRDKLASETIWAKQQESLQSRLASLRPQRKSVNDLYFLSYAPDATEDVFLREVTVIERLMEDRFDAKGRAIRLINHHTQYRSNGAASVTNLRQALKHLGSLMDRDEDVLLLYLTGHGSRGHELVAKADTMDLENLQGPQLDQLLEEAGIRYVIVAVSACYSGAWVPALAKPDRFVMTASASDRTSFGCGSESDFTFWGRAVFDEGLRASFSFEQAFQRAIPVLKLREREAKHPWSDPQIAVGEQIRPILSLLERRLSGVSVPVSEAFAAQK